MVPIGNPNQPILTRNVARRRKLLTGSLCDMAAVDTMGEVEEMPSAEENFKNEVALNGDSNEEEMTKESTVKATKLVIDVSDSPEPEIMEIDEQETNEVDDKEEGDNCSVDSQDDEVSSQSQQDEDDVVMVESKSDTDEDNVDNEGEDVVEGRENGSCDSQERENDEISSVSQEDVSEETESVKNEDSRANSALSDSEEVKIIEEEEKIEDVACVKEENEEKTTTSNDLNENDSNVIVLDGKENSSSDANQNRKHKMLNCDEVIDVDSPAKKKKKTKPTPTPEQPSRRSTRNLARGRKSYVEDDVDYVETVEKTRKKQESEESDIEEILPVDPLADHDNNKSTLSSSSTIVVKDTKRLVEIASQSNSSNLSKKEPTLVIIDTNSILSGRGPIPITQKSSNSTVTTAATFPIIPMALPAQGVYPANMRATITPIPIGTSSAKGTSILTPSLTNVTVQTASLLSASAQQPVLPTLTDDMFVVEAPSFIVPYVYEKPPVKEMKEFLKEIEEEKKKMEKLNKSDDEKGSSKENVKIEKIDVDEVDITGPENKKDDESKAKDKDQNEKKEGTSDKSQEDAKKLKTYFDTPLGTFFVDLGLGLVQEFFQTDLLKQQKKKRDREQGLNKETNMTIESLIKNLEFSKENNQPFKLELKKCQFCSFKTESSLAMAFHLETPHMKNYIYRCNFCPYEIRSPHDILFHMEAEHGVRGRLERAPAFHQCPSCPFEDNQKGKLSRHLIACARKFRPERNLEPPVDWDPPAKIPRAPRMKQTGLNATAAMYQAMAQRAPNPYQIMQKLVQQQPSMQMVQRGRGRPSLSNAKTPTVKATGGMMYKQMSGGSVFVPNYQLSGNQVFQVVGGQEMGARLASLGSTAFVPNLSTASPTSVTIQQQTQQSQTTSGGGKSKSIQQQPSISITPLPRGSASNSTSTMLKPGDSSAKNSFVICEICDGYIKDLEQLRNHMQWIHKVKIHPKMIYNRPPLNCQKCQFRFFTDQGLERHLLGSHGLVTSSMQEAANKSKDSGRCPVCGRVYQWKLLNHVARDHNMTLKPAHLSYKCTVCTATFGMYKQFENHVYSAHSVVAKRVNSIDKKGSTSNNVGGTSSSSSSSKNDSSLLKPLKINDEITIIPQPAKSISAGGTVGGNKDIMSSTRMIDSGSSKPLSESSLSLLSRAERLVRQKTASHSKVGD